MLEKIDVEEDEALSRTPVMYSLQDMDLPSIAVAYQFLTSAVPDARFSPGAQRGH
jgi:hypothetical protein